MASCQKLGKQISYRLLEGWSDIGTVAIFFKKIIAVIIISLVFCFSYDMRIKLIKFKQWPEKAIQKNPWGRFNLQ